jgi:hypothetical protein
MKTKLISLLFGILGIMQSFGQSSTQRLPVIDMHCHIYSATDNKINRFVTVFAFAPTPKTDL